MAIVGVSNFIFISDTNLFLFPFLSVQSSFSDVFRETSNKGVCFFLIFGLVFDESLKDPY